MNSVYIFFIIINVQMYFIFQSSDEIFERFFLNMTGGECISIIFNMKSLSLNLGKIKT